MGAVLLYVKLGLKRRFFHTTNQKKTRINMKTRGKKKKNGNTFFVLWDEQVFKKSQVSSNRSGVVWHSVSNICTSLMVMVCIYHHLATLHYQITVEQLKRERSKARVIIWYSVEISGWYNLAHFHYAIIIIVMSILQTNKQKRRLLDPPFLEVCLFYCGFYCRDFWRKNNVFKKRCCCGSWFWLEYKTARDEEDDGDSQRLT